MTKPAHKIHPAANLFPIMESAELKELAANIKKNGLFADIVRDKDGVILDGRNRLEACRIAGVEPSFVQYNDTDPVAFIVAANIHRRHLTTKQKRELVGKLLKLNPEKSDRLIAAIAKVDHKTVTKVRQKKVARGEIPHVAKHTDAKGRKQPASKKTATPTVIEVEATVCAAPPPKADRTSVKALAEFEYAVDQYVPKLNQTTRTMSNAFVKLVFIGVLAAVALAGCSSTFSQPEVRQARAADPLTSPPASLVVYEALQATR